ncbi:DUF2589 domain-containing protein [uncultured Tenacibaculum sp.]|uniref:DUF2589 domain-containing protein n=1 Tax=uncultured Tenacibaculum sp. TaxID=174713 RepID=UPI00262B1EB3|nr:DUF2589 domain-containing protein [uncultured Tenacibaculum sp.]
MSLSNYNPGQELASIDFAGMIGGPLSAIVDAQSKAALSTVDFVKSVGFTPDTEDEATGEIKPGEPIYVSFKYPKMVAPYQPAIKGKLDSVTISAAGTNYVVGDILTAGGLSIEVTAVSNTGAITQISTNLELTGIDDENGAAATGGSGTGAEFDITTEDKDAVPAQFEEMQLQVPIITMMPIPFIRVEEGNIDFNAKITSMEYKRVGSEFKFNTGFSYGNQNTNKNYALGPGVFNVNKNTNTVKLNTSISYQRNSRQGHKIDKTFHLGVKVKVSQDEIPEGMEKLLGILEDAIVSQPVE